MTPALGREEPPRFPLAVLPTPLIPARRLQQAIGGPLVWVKRDDLIGFATAGNKARPLELFIGDALARGCDVLVSGGGPGSNFCAAAAAAARMAGIDCHLVISGSAPAVAAAPASEHPNMVAARAAGARLHFTGRPDREELDVAVPALAAELSDRGRRPLALPRGGATPLGATAFAFAYHELHAQLASADVAAGVLVLATGSGGSHAGLVAALAGGVENLRCYSALNFPHPRRVSRILGATVSRPPDQIRETVTNLARACASRLGIPPEESPGPESVEIVDARGPGFGIASDEGEVAARVARETEGLLFDPVYTAKAFAVVLELIRDGFDQPIVFWHTGGLPSALAHLAAANPPAPDPPAPRASASTPPAAPSPPAPERSDLCPSPT